MALSEEELKRIRARADAATPGPWTTWEKNPTDEYYASCFPADEEFIGHARDDVPALLDEVERLRTALKLIDNNTCEDGHLFIGGNPFDVSWDDLKCTRCGFRFVETRLK
jgi:hypothetical protein